MKFTLYLILFSCFLFPVSLHAQDSLYVVPVEKQMSLGLNMGFTIGIPQARLKDVVNAWKKYIRRGETKNAVEYKDEEYSMHGTVLTNVSAQPVNVYTQIKEVDNAIRLTAWFSTDDTVFISAAVDAEQSQSVEMLMKDFARAQYRLAVENELNTETKNLEKLEGEKDELIDANENATKNIREYERKIGKAKADIESNRIEQSKRSAEVANQKEIVRSTTPKTETYELEEKKYNSLEKELRKLEREGESLHGDIDDWNADIRLQERTIEKNEDSIKEKKESISKQKDKVKEVKKELENIR